MGLPMVVTPTTQTEVPIVLYRGCRAIKFCLLVPVVPTQYILKSIIIQTASFSNGQPVFPPPSIHPAMMQPSYLLHGNWNIFVFSQAIKYFSENNPGVPVPCKRGMDRRLNGEDSSDEEGQVRTTMASGKT